MLYSIFKICDFIRKICYWNYFSVIFFSMEFIVLHAKVTRCSLGPQHSAGVLLEGLLQWGEQQARSCQESAGLEGHYSTMSNKKSRAGPMRVMVVKVRCRPGITRWVRRDESYSISSENLSPQRNFRISQVRHCITVFKLQSFTLIISWNLPPKPVSAWRNFYFRKYFMICFCSLFRNQHPKK